MTQEQVSNEEQVSQATETEQTTENQTTETQQTEPQALTQEQVQQMIADATKQAIEEGKKLGRSELQSQQDRNRAEMARLERRARLGDQTREAVRTSLQGFDPEAAKEMELAELRAERQTLSQIEQEEAARQQQAQFHDDFVATQTQFITELGLDPNDQRIDWAGDAPNYLVAMQRIQASVAKLQKENIANTQTAMDKRLNDLEKQIAGVNVEVNSVDTTASQGAVPGSDADFKAKFANYELPMTKANIDRYNKILEQSQ